jgi:hypothetical protein
MPTPSLSRRTFGSLAWRPLWFLSLARRCSGGFIGVCDGRDASLSELDHFAVSILF